MIDAKTKAEALMYDVVMRAAKNMQAQIDGVDEEIAAHGDDGVGTMTVRDTMVEGLKIANGLLDLYRPSAQRFVNAYLGFEDVAPDP